MSVHSLGKSVKILSALTPIMSLMSFICFLVAFISPYWIFVEEKFPNKNRTVLFGPNASIEYFQRNSYGGLWTICSSSYMNHELTCRYIEYFSSRSYEPDPYDSSLVIPYSILNSAGFIFTAGTFMFIGGILLAMGNLMKKRKILTFVSGIVFILSGLLLFIGQIVFIAVFKTEVGGKLVPKTPLSPPLVSYKYGCSFTLLILSFLLSELTGTFAIFYFIYHYQYKWSCKELPSYNHNKSKTDSSKLSLNKKGENRSATPGSSTPSTTVCANKTNGFIPNRRHSFDNINELNHSNHQISNGGPNWNFDRNSNQTTPTGTTPISSSTSTKVPTSVLTFEEDNCPRHRSQTNNRGACFCHNNQCPNTFPNANDYCNLLTPVNLSHRDWWSIYWSLPKDQSGRMVHYPQNGLRRPFPQRTSFFPPMESDGDDSLSPSRVLNLEVNVSKSPLPGKGILKQTKKFLNT
uniref:Voltagedependent calcium channel gamma7 subunitlike [Bombus terrestris] n=1 Tax=Lepeophtheirus salmonis TaxID=72036 RepID=A0A0K2T929_LEPSM